MIICKQCGRVSKKSHLGFCRKHYEQFKKFGKCLDSNPRTRKDPNGYEIHNDYINVFVYDINNEVKYTFIVDIEYLPLIINYKWTYTKPKKTSDRELVYMINKKLGLFHRFIMDNPNETVDHINRNTFDNRKQNLRICSYSEQNMNTCVNSTRFDIKGIDIHRNPNRKKRYMARFSYNKKTYRSPWYETYEEAVFSRSLLEQLSPIKVYNNDFYKHIKNLDENKKKNIILWFRNRFKNRV